MNVKRAKYVVLAFHFQPRSQAPLLCLPCRWERDPGCGWSRDHQESGW